MKASPYPESRVGSNFDDIVSSAAPTTSNYAQDLSPYSNSPFSYTTPSREHTPASSAPSPPFDDKSPGHYASLQPPVTHSYYPYVGPVATQAQSLLSISAPPVSESHFETQMADYISASPSVPYFGHFCVSEVSADVNRNAQLRDRYAFPSAVMETMQTGEQEMFNPNTSNQPQYRTPRSHIGDTHTAYSPMPSNNMPSQQQDSKAGKRRSAAARTARARPAAVRRRSMAVRAKDASPIRSRGSNKTGEASSSSKSSMKPTLQLRDEAREEEKVLMELRRELSDDKGKGMWEEITKRYISIYEYIERSALQMKLTRAINAHCIWPQEELDLLVEAYRVDNEQRYNRIIQWMSEHGGCKVWPWRPKHIEAQLVKLGLEEPELHNQERSRRRATNARKKNTSQAVAVINRDPAGNGDVTTWVKVIPAQATVDFNTPPYQQPPVSQPFHQRSNGFAGPKKLSPHPLDTSVGGQEVVDHHFFSNEARDKLLDQIEQKYYPDPDDTPTTSQSAEFLEHVKMETQSPVETRQGPGFHANMAMRSSQQHGSGQHHGNNLPSKTEY
ncbi:hypothetical protein MCOR25_004022 [Pyricularia grisea]|uniref:Uncharacterized protein n=1 Tax=Pyricularia grisea TaxID=148305 RepID=A0A6P8AVB1_PYRGI|nr:uncharacterized protein PgNI_08649 [Pyricularia grisea]KAI6371087.1 hypothetical protein MCOR25_004022 [Pyricularia grisea]TLD06161.1 hypothetical protein PgNI_08649 [Pyricularia grisea]